MSAPVMTDEQRSAYVRSLLEEKEGYVRRGMDARVAAVDAELERMGHVGPNVERRPRRPKEARTNMRAAA